jgi:hypothetical protein
MRRRNRLWKNNRERELFQDIAISVGFVLTTLILTYVVITLFTGQG